MHAILDYLTHNKRYWLTPIVLWLLLLVYLAWRTAEMPAEPFDYRFD